MKNTPASGLIQPGTITKAWHSAGALGVGWNSLALWDNCFPKLNVSRQGARAEIQPTASGALSGRALPADCDRGFFPSTQLRWNTCGVLSPVLRLPVRERGTYWSKSNGGQWRWLKDWSVSLKGEAERAGTIQPQEGKAAQRILSICINVWLWGVMEKETDFSVESYRGKRINSHK